MITWRFDADGQTLALASDGGLPRAIHWGTPLPPDTDLGAIAIAAEADVTGGMMDENAPLTTCPLPGDGWQGQPGLVAYRDGQPLTPRFRHARDLTFTDDALGLTYALDVQTSGTTLRLSARLTAATPLTLHWLTAPALPGPQQGDILDLHGRWIGELQPTRTAWSPGARLREARSGRSGHEHPPLAYFPGDGTTNTRGPCWAMHLNWSGGHRMLAEELPDGRRQIQMGAASGAETTPGTDFQTPALTVTYSERGLNGCAVAFQRDLRARVPALPPRRVHYNGWEAVYFDHDPATLKDIASRAASLGAERFVLDDGWFGRRDDDTTSLGDWQVDVRKWPDGLRPLIDHVRGLGMDFGLWVEPEMVNPDSDLARAHPDWVLGPRDQITGRQQWVLDMANPAVRDHLFDALSALLTSYDIAYLKWDHNRLLPMVDAAQTRGTYALLDRLLAAQDVEIESCASGGGRIDGGILARCNRVWLSDSNDALERARIQHDAALWLPGALTGSHVGPRTCHTSGRTLPIETRAWVAAQRHMGFEMDPRELTEAEATTLAHVTRWWKANRDWRHAADIHRLDHADPALIAEQQIAPEGDRFVVFATQAATSSQILPRPLRLTALDPDASYRLSLLTVGDLPGLSRGSPALKSGDVTLPGSYLMTQGLTLPWTFPDRVHVLEGTRL